MLKKITGALLALGFAGLTWAQQIDLNKASEVELDALKGVGPVLTKAVMDERKKAPFKDWEDATSRVKGLGTQKAISLSEQGVRVQGSAYTGKAAGKTTEKKPVKAADSAKDAPKDSGKAAPKNADASAAKASPAKN
jgi:competence protein ComEA